MNKEQAIEILIQVAHIAQKGGLLNLNDAPAVAQAVSFLTPKKEDEEKKPEASAEETK